MKIHVVPTEYHEELKVGGGQLLSREETAHEDLVLRLGGGELVEPTVVAGEDLSLAEIKKISQLEAERRGIALI